MRVIDKDLHIVDDGWQLVIDEAELPAGDVIVSVARWQKERDALLARGGRLGLKVGGDTPVTTIADDLEHFALIALEFPKFGDGRCFSHARLLRERYNYKGELRAVGDVQRDQLYFMRRCGIDSFAVRADKDIEDALNAFKEFTVRYQPAADDAQPIYRYR
ncbi:MAG TPA: DUF934 domain-containing protein [Gammaproteobacteria bacterium]|nr:DUF934 domain-containing protein [Gammaproteobacteria bacterium]